MSIVSGIVNNLEMISGLWEGMCGLYTSRTLFSIKVLSSMVVGFLGVNSW